MTMTFEESLRLVLEADEGIVHEIYEDHLGNVRRAASGTFWFRKTGNTGGR
jgi:hypothetical protein